MRVKVSGEFKVNRTRMCKPPWPAFGDARFEILRAGDREFSEWLAEHHRNSPVAKKANSVIMHAQIARQGARKGKGDAAAERIIREADFENAVAVYEQTNLESAKRLLKGWDGIMDEDGGAIEFTDETRDELFAIDYATVPKTVPGDVAEPGGDDADEDEGGDEDNASAGVTIVDGSSLGAAMVHWVLFEARQHEEYREGWIEEQAKN